MVLIGHALKNSLLPVVTVVGLQFGGLVGGSVVTSNISSKFLPGILIGYISELNEDSNKLTKSGTVTPVVDFKHLQEVLVILELKEVGSENGN